MHRREQQRTAVHIQRHFGNRLGYEWLELSLERLADEQCEPDGFKRCEVLTGLYVNSESNSVHRLSNCRQRNCLGTAATC